MAVEYLGLGEDDGTVLGRGSTDKIAFYGGTPAAKSALTLIGALTAGETTPADVAAALVELNDYLVARGLYSES